MNQGTQIRLAGYLLRELTGPAPLWRRSVEYSMDTSCLSEDCSRWGCGTGEMGVSMTRKSGDAVECLNPTPIMATDRMPGTVRRFF
jgi:hypothetical protein